MDESIERYRDEAVRFTPRCAPGASMRVAATPVTCRVAVALLNAIGLPPEPAMAYVHVNVHNPDCPLHYNMLARCWACRSRHANHPVSCISWSGAQLMCGFLGARLARAGEWECFATNNELARAYPWGDAAPSRLLANFDEHFGGTTPVGQFPPSEIGLYDLAGNVGEWCLDPYAGGAPLERAIKGGAWSKPAHHLRIASTRGKWARLGTRTVGVRPVWDDRR
jgi:hypothetical protein